MQYLSHTPEDTKAMLEAIGVKDFDSLIAKVPKALRNFEMKLPRGISELELVREMAEIGRLPSEIGIPCYPQGHTFISDRRLLDAFRARLTPLNSVEGVTLYALPEDAAYGDGLFQCLDVRRRVGFSGGWAFSASLKRS